MAEVKANKSDWFYDLFIEEAKSALDYHASKGTGGGSGAGVKTCTVHLNARRQGWSLPTLHNYIFCKYENGKIESVMVGEDGGVLFQDEEFDITIENVVCGTYMFVCVSTMNGVIVERDDSKVTLLGSDEEWGYWMVSPDATEVALTYIAA